MGQSNCAYTLGFYPYAGVVFNGPHNIDEIDIFQLQDGNPLTPAPGMTFSKYGANTFRVFYCPTGATNCYSPSTTYPIGGPGWVPVAYSYPGSTDPGYNHVWDTFKFASASATEVLFLFECTDSPTPYLAEIEAWDTVTPVGTNWAAAANGATVNVTSTWSQTGFNFSAANIIDGDRVGFNAGHTPKGVWASGAQPTSASPQYVTITFNGTKTITEFDVFTRQYTSPGAVPTLGLADTQYWLANSYNVQYWDSGSSSWLTAGTMLGNKNIWNQFQISPPITTNQVRLQIVNATDYTCPNCVGVDVTEIAEFEAWDFTSGQGATSRDALVALGMRQGMTNAVAYSGLGTTPCTGLTSTISNTAINGIGGFQQSCGAAWINVASPNNGAWLLPALTYLNAPSPIANKYLGGSTWPSSPTNSMSAMGFPIGPYINSDGQLRPDGQNEYQLFSSGILATAGGRTDSHQIGGVAPCSNTTCMPTRPTIPPPATCSCNATSINTSLTNLWLSQSFNNKYPMTDSSEYSLGIDTKPSCGPSPFGNRAWYFTSVNPSVAFTMKDGQSPSIRAHMIGNLAADNETVWSNAGCQTQTALGWPISDEQQYTVGNNQLATHQEFDFGTITNCGGGTDPSPHMSPKISVKTLCSLSSSPNFVTSGSNWSAFMLGRAP
jgi:hypothetical protein